MLKLATYNGQEADFYIQSKGNNAGRPLLKPIANSFAVWTDTPNAFEIIEVLWIARKFDYYITGSVIPFIRLCEIRPYLCQALKGSFSKKDLEKLKLVELLRINTKKRLNDVCTLKKAYALEIIKQA